jgi:GNAT superfamily N-acetyltransferase
MIAAWRRTRAELGTREALFYGVDRGLRALSGGRARLVRYRLLAQPITAPPAAGRTGGSIRVREVTAADPVTARFPRPPEVIARRFADGATCLVAESKGRFVGFLWLAFGAYDEDEVRCRYVLADPARSAWDYDVYVVPEFRLGRAFVRLWEAAQAHLSARGVHWSFSRINRFNRASLDAHRRLGAVELGAAGFLCLGRLQLMVGAGPGVPGIGLSWRGRPVLSLTAPAEPPGGAHG